MGSSPYQDQNPTVLLWKGLFVPGLSVSGTASTSQGKTHCTVGYQRRENGNSSPPFQNNHIINLSLQMSRLALNHSDRWRNSKYFQTTLNKLTKEKACKGRGISRVKLATVLFCWHAMRKCLSWMSIVDDVMLCHTVFFPHYKKGKRETHMLTHAVIYSTVSVALTIKNAPGICAAYVGEHRDKGQRLCVTG